MEAVGLPEQLSTAVLAPSSTPGARCPAPHHSPPAVPAPALLEASVKATLRRLLTAAAQRNSPNYNGVININTLISQGWEPALARPYLRREEKDGWRAERLLTERVTGTLKFNKKIIKRACVQTHLYLYTRLYIVKLKHGEIKWIGYSPDVLKLVFM